MNLLVDVSAVGKFLEGRIQLSVIIDLLHNSSVYK